MELKERLIPVDIKTTMLDPNANYQLKADLIPSFRNIIATQNGVSKKILLKSWGGLGDMITAEPTIRYAVENFHGYEISLEAMIPSLFSHLKFHKVYDHFENENLKDQGKKPLYDDSEFYIFNTICSDTHFPWEFACGLYCHCVDFSSLIAFRMQLPIKNREIILHPSEENYGKINEIFEKKLNGKYFIVIHAGKHWPSKTFPKWWWDSVIDIIKSNNITPVLIGGHKDDASGLRTTVDINPDGCLDLRCELEVMDTVALLKRSNVLLTNDSAPLHMAASTNCWIGYIATCKRPEYITHYRHGEFGWRMKNLGLGGIWEDSHALCDLGVMNVELDKLLEWLPEPNSFAQWGINRLFITDSTP